MKNEKDKGDHGVKSADFLIRAIMLFTTILTLLFLYEQYGRFELVLLNLILIVAIIWSGIGKMLNVKRSK